MKTKFDVPDDTVDNHVTGVPLMIGTQFEMERVVCPFCHGNFAVDSDYLDIVDSDIHCPMCCMEVHILEPEW